MLLVWFLKSKLLKICNFGKIKKFRLDVTILKNKNNPKIVILSAYGEFLAENTFLKIKTVEDMIFR